MITHRLVLAPRVNPRGLFTEPTVPEENTPLAEREMVERINRINFTAHFHYEDPFSRITPSVTYDESGNYRCGDCNKQNGTNDCLLIPIDVDLQAGSCEHWEAKCASDREIDLSKNGITAEDVGYGVAKNGQGFGCKRCPFASPSHAPDSLGRTLYCGKGDFRVFPNACCALNGAALISEFEGNTEQAGDDGDTYLAPEADDAPEVKAPKSSSRPSYNAAAQLANLHKART